MLLSLHGDNMKRYHWLSNKLVFGNAVEFPGWLSHWHHFFACLYADKCTAHVINRGSCKYYVRYTSYISSKHRRTATPKDIGHDKCNSVWAGTWPGWTSCRKPLPKFRQNIPWNLKHVMFCGWGAWIDWQWEFLEFLYSAQHSYYHIIHWLLGVRIQILTSLASLARAAEETSSWEPPLGLQGSHAKSRNEHNNDNNTFFFFFCTTWFNTDVLLL